MYARTLAESHRLCVSVCVAGFSSPVSNRHHDLSLRTNTTQHSINPQSEAQSLTRCDFNAKHTCLFNLNHKLRLQQRRRSQLPRSWRFRMKSKLSSKQKKAKHSQRKLESPFRLLPFSFFCVQPWRCHGEDYCLLIHALVLRMCAREALTAQYADIGRVT